MSSAPETSVLTVLVTAPDMVQGERLARALVEERLAACANVVPRVVSLYWWEESVQRNEEALLILKTTAGRLAALESRVLELHPYEVPEVLALEVRHGHEPYLAWVCEQVVRKGA